MNTSNYIIRHASPDDIPALASVESECFPAAEAATESEIAARVQAYGEHFWLLYDDTELIAFVDGMTTDHADLTDDMYADADLHNETGAWQMIFGVNTIPSRRRQGCAELLIRQAIADAKTQGRKGLVLTCKDALIHYYAKFGFKNEGISQSVHGNVTWYQMRLTFSAKVAITACSDPMKPDFQPNMERLCNILRDIGYEPVLSNCIYPKENGLHGTGAERAAELMRFYTDSEITAIFDISGGDMSNELLPYLGFSVIASSGKRFYGYSDLTTILNAIYARTGKEAVLYQIRNLLYRHGDTQIHDLTATLKEHRDTLYDLDYHFIQGNSMEGILIGGNIRCFLKLAGTEYMPDFRGKILLLEALNTGVPQLITFLSQLKQLHAFEQVGGILLGTFTRMEQEQMQPDAITLVREFAGPELPIAKTAYIGHGPDSRGAVIGKYYTF